MTDITPHRILGVALLAAVVGLARPAPAAPDTPADARLEPPEFYHEIAKRLARQMPREHLSRTPLNDTIAERTWTNYLNTLDFGHVYFLQSDIDGFRLHSDQLDDALFDGNLAFAYDVFHVFRQRARDRYEYVKQRLEQGFDLTVDETYVWQRKDQPWPANPVEMDEIWRRKIKNEYVRALVARMSNEAEAAADADAENKPDPAPDPEAPDAAPAPDEPIDEEPDAPAPSIEETILKRYRQVVTMLDDADAEWVLERYLSAFAHAYDPHSDYMSASALEDFNIEMKLSLVGVGALLRSEEGAAKIVRIIPGGPAHRDKREKRLRPGDKIIAVGQDDEEPVDVLHWPLHKVVRLIRGEKGTRVVLVVIPASDPSGATTKAVDLIRDEVKLEEQAASSEIRMLPVDDGITRKLGIITLPAFYANMKALSPDDPEFRSSAYDIQKLLQDFDREGVEGVVLDLRNNGGGSLLEAIRLTGLFIRTGPTVQVRERFRTRILPDRDPRTAYDGPLVVLVNRLSASASEIVAGALQDYGRAVIVGDSKTHGKGTVQSLLQINGEEKLGAAKITTASYYRISGASTQLKGIMADIVLPSPFDFMELGEESLNNPLPWNTIGKVRYTPVDDLQPVIAELKRRSDLRLSTDTRYHTYRELLDRIEELNATDTLPLNLDKRRQFHRMEEELEDLQERLAPDPGEAEDPESDERPQVILDETLRILADLVALQPAATGEMADDETQNRPRSIEQAIVEWLKNL